VTTITSISERLDDLLAELPDDAWTISHDEATDYRVCTIVIDWRRLPGEIGLRLVHPEETP
jgi:hypothetical protein